MSTGIAEIDDALEALRAGRVVIVVDDEDRENEGDFVVAAQYATPETIQFLVEHARGLVCMPILPELARRLDLRPIEPDHRSRLQGTHHGTPYTESVDHVQSGTGISASARARTIQAILDPQTRPEDLRRPGHLFPLVAKEGGVLRRAGHTEAAIDLMRLAGLQPAAVICEVLDGTGVASRQKLQEISNQHDLPIVAIETLIKYRRRVEKLVRRLVETQMPTHYGEGRLIVYEVDHEPENNPMALVFGDLRAANAPLVRLHSSCFTGDLLMSLRCDCGDQLHLALAMIGQEGVGALIYLPQEGRGIGLVEKIKAYVLQDRGLDTVEANVELGFKADHRDYGIGLQILQDLGIRKVRLLTNNPKKTESFVMNGHGLEVVDQVPIIAPPHVHRARYMAVKRDKLGHHLPPEDDASVTVDLGESS